MNQFSLNEDGIVEQAHYIESPNQDGRPENCEPCLIVVHNISLPPNEFGGPGIVALFTNTLNPKDHPYYQEIAYLRVSAHFLIRRDGDLLQFVSCQQRAWHAGISIWQGLERCNDFSIGIELEGTDETPFHENQYETLTALISAIKQRYPIKAITGHSDIAPGRKTDPGPYFEWAKIT